MTFVSIVKEHGKRLFNLAYRICGEEFLAEDLLQESLLQIHRALPSFRKESTTYSWAYKITLNNCLKHSLGKEMRAQAEAALRRLDSQEESNPISKAVKHEPNEVLVEKAMMAEIREKCHYFIGGIYLTQPTTTYSIRGCDRGLSADAHRNGTSVCHRGGLQAVPV
jgi:RNA polymerase sigma factor (sigma-70 family)